MVTCFNPAKKRHPGILHIHQSFIYRLPPYVYLRRNGGQLGRRHFRRYHCSCCIVLLVNLSHIRKLDSHLHYAHLNHELAVVIGKGQYLSFLAQCAYIHRLAQAYLLNRFIILVGLPGFSSKFILYSISRLCFNLILYCSMALLRSFSAAICDSLFNSLMI